MPPPTSPETKSEVNTMRIQSTFAFAALIVAMATVPSVAVLAADAPEVTIQNYVRAETDLQMRNYVENMDAFGKFAHVREAYDVTSRDTIRPNRDTRYSRSVPTNLPSEMSRSTRSGRSPCITRRGSSIATIRMLTA